MGMNINGGYNFPVATTNQPVEVLTYKKEKQIREEEKAEGRKKLAIGAACVAAAAIAGIAIAKSPNMRGKIKNAVKALKTKGTTNIDDVAKAASNATNPINGAVKTTQTVTEKVADKVDDVASALQKDIDSVNGKIREKATLYKVMGADLNAQRAELKTLTKQLEGKQPIGENMKKMFDRKAKLEKSTTELTEKIKSAVKDVKPLRQERTQLYSMTELGATPEKLYADKVLAQRAKKTAEKTTQDAQTEITRIKSYLDEKTKENRILNNELNVERAKTKKAQLEVDSSTQKASKPEPNPATSAQGIVPGNSKSQAAQTAKPKHWWQNFFKKSTPNYANEACGTKREDWKKTRKGFRTIYQSKTVKNVFLTNKAYKQTFKK